MRSVLRSWCPKDLMSLKVLTCKNPARDIGDVGSHTNTLGKPAVSKILSGVVELFSKMAFVKQTQAEKRGEQNLSAFKKGTEDVSVTGNIYSRELQTLEDRLRGVEEPSNGNVSIEDVIRSTRRLKKAVDNHTNAIAAHCLSFLMAVKSMAQASNTATNDNKAEIVKDAALQVPVVNRRQRRRVPSGTPQNMEPVIETPADTETVRVFRVLALPHPDLVVVCHHPDMHLVRN